MKRIFAFALSAFAVVVFASAVHAEQSAAAASCLAAVEQGDYQQGVTLCTKALEAEPDNAQVKQALQTAKAAIEAGGGVGSPPPAEGGTQ